MHHRTSPVILLLLSCLPAMALTTPLLERQFTQIVQPYLAKNCAGCHSGKTPAGSLDLKAYTSTDAVIRDYPRWATVHTRLAAGEMPPKPMAAPPVEESRKVLNWIQAVRTEELRKHAFGIRPRNFNRRSVRHANSDGRTVGDSNRAISDGRSHARSGTDESGPSFHNGPCGKHGRARRHKSARPGRTRRRTAFDSRDSF